MRVRLIGVLLCLGLAACQMSLPFRKDAPPAASAAGVTAAPGAIMGGPITATPIKPGSATAPVAAPTAATSSPPVTPPPAAAGEVPPATPAVVTPPALKSGAQLACERKKGTWSSAGKIGKLCVFPTRDGGKACSAETDCDGLCLARSGTCSPVKPLFGCNEILDSTGRKVTLCID